MNLETILMLITIISILLTLMKVLGSLAGAALSLTKWFLLSIIAVMIVWGLYNQVAVRTGWWTPISLDRFIEPYLEPLTAAWNGFKTWLLRKLGVGGVLA